MQPERTQPGPGQESVWDYPRPPVIERCDKRVKVVFGGHVIAESDRAVRVLETAGPPTIYVPLQDVETKFTRPVDDYSTVCEWKGEATYLDIVVDDEVASKAAWTYLSPKEAFEELAGHVSFYPARLDGCFLDDEKVRPQPGDFYGGWVTDDIAGPFKGEPGTGAW